MTLIAISKQNDSWQDLITHPESKTKARKLKTSLEELANNYNCQKSRTIHLHITTHAQHA